MLKRKVSWMQIVLMLLLGFVLVYVITPQVMAALGLRNAPILSINSERGTYDLLFTPDNRFLVTYEDTKSVYLRSLKYGNIVREFSADDARINAIAVHPSKPLFAASATDDLVWLWDYQTGHVVNKFTAPSGNLGIISFSPNGEYLVARTRSEDDLLYVWQLDDFALIQEMDGHNTGYGLEFSHDNKYLISSNPFRMWNIEDGSLVKQLTSGSALWTIKVSKNAPYTIASAFEGKEIYLWEQQSNKLEMIASRPNYICGIAISDDGQFVASAPCLPVTQDRSSATYNLSDQSIRIWDRADGRLVQEIALPIRDTHTLTFSPDGTMIAAANGLYGPITVWRVNP